MRLLHRQADGSFSLTPPLAGDKIPRYAILSHTWGKDEDEVTFDDVLGCTGHEKQGYEKLRFCAEQAATDNLEYFWIDTCCIKKSSDCELSEAITSMYRWYSNSTKCYVYLWDVSLTTGNKPFERSRWFTRGWTLQELLAPKVVEFFDKDRKFLGTKENMKGQIAHITDISIEALSGKPLSEFPAVTLLKWAKRRSTTRPEDAAYCMFGMFGVFLPLLYGEGENAMARLLAEVQRKQHKNPTDVKAYLQTLRFDQIEDRYSNIRAAHVDTCNWIYNNAEYRRWLDNDQLVQHHGLLWLKGNPGSGKSTLIKHALSNNKHERRQDIHISFFFTARATSLEKDTLGMYRSLLYQLLQDSKMATELFEEYDVYELPQAVLNVWTIPRLQDLFKRALRKLGNRPLWIYIDALDECDEDQVRDMVVFFHEIGVYAMQAKIQMRVFFTSRYYPQISTPNKVEILLEDEPEHGQDITRFVNSSLNVGLPAEINALDDVRKEVIERAKGIFVWAFVIVEMLKKAYDHGNILALQRIMTDPPENLSHLFEEVLVRGGKDDEVMKISIRWILFAKRPLKLREHYFAVQSAIHPENLKDLDPDKISDQEMKAFVLSSSRGLAELTESENPVVQFIHETVREFFLARESRRSGSDTTASIDLGATHDIMKKCCVAYMSFAETNPLVKSVLQGQSQGKKENLPPDYENKFFKEQSKALLQKLPFVAYAESYCLDHADDAETGNQPQDSFLREFDTSRWNRMRWVLMVYFRASEEQYSLNRHTNLASERPLLYIIAQKRLRSLLVTWKRMHPDATVDQGAPLSPIRAALECQPLAVDCLRVLVTGIWAISPTDYTPSDSELTQLGHTYAFSPKVIRESHISHILYSYGSEHEFLTLIRCGTFGLKDDALALAIDRGYQVAAEHLLLEALGVDCNRKGDRGLTPLMRAAREGRSRVVTLLLERAELDVNLDSEAQRTALSYAAEKGYVMVCRVLLEDPRTNANQCDEKGRTALHFASMNGKDAIIELFMSNPNVDLLSKTKIGHNALSYAAMHGHLNTTKQLLRIEHMDINTKDTLHGRTPLIFALEHRYYSLAKLLLARQNITISICTKGHKSPQSFAKEAKEHEESRLASDPGNQESQRLLEEAQAVCDLIKTKVDNGADNGVDSEVDNVETNDDFSNDEEWELESIA